MKVIQVTDAGCALRDRVIEHTTLHSPFARLDRESRLRLHALLFEVVTGTNELDTIPPSAGDSDKEKR